MAVDLSVIESDFINIRTDWPTTFLHKNKSYTGMFSSNADQLGLQEGGFIQQFDAELLILIADFIKLPEVGDNIVISSVIYRVGKFNNSPDNKIASLTLISPEK